MVDEGIKFVYYLKHNKIEIFSLRLLFSALSDSQGADQYAPDGGSGS